MPTAVEKMAGEIRGRREKLLAFYEKKQADGTLDITATERDQMKAINTELNDLTPKWEKLREDEKAEAENKKSLELMKEVILPEGFHGGGGGRLVGSDGHYLDRRGEAVKGLGDLFTESKSYKSWSDSRKSGSGDPPKIQAFAPDANIKTLFATTAGWDPFVTRLPGTVLSPQQQPKVVDLIPMGNTGEHSIKFMLETLYANAAAEVAEGGTYQESAFQLTEQIRPVNKLGVTLPATDEQLADVTGARDYLNGRLELGLKQRLDLQLLQGNGTLPNLQGLFNQAGIQTQPLGNDPVPDAFFKAMTLIQSVGFADPSGIIMHPQNWQDVRLLRTSQGLYIWGNPDQVGPQRMWGIPVVSTTYCTFGSGLVADFVMYTMLYYRKGIDFLVTNSHASEFTSGVQRVRADMRVAFVVFRPLAICQVTGMRSA